MIGFSRRRATVVETALMFLYVVYGGWMSGKEESLEPRQFGQGWLTSGWGQARPIPVFTGNSSHQLSASNLFENLHIPEAAVVPLSTLKNIIGYALQLFGTAMGINVSQLARVASGAVGMSEGKIGSRSGSKTTDVIGLAMAMLNHSGGAISRM